MNDSPTPPKERRFDDLTLTEAIGQFRRAPRATWQMLRQTLTRRPSRQHQSPTVPRAKDIPSQTAATITIDYVGLIRAGVWFMAFLAGLIGCFNVNIPNYTANGRPGLLFATPISNALGWWGVAFVLAATAEIWAWNRGRLLPDVPKFSSPSAEMPYRWQALILAPPLLLVGYAGQGYNQFTLVGVAGWLAGIVALLVGLWPRNLDPLVGIGQWLAHLKSAPRRKPVTLIALLAIMLIAGYLRAYELDAIPAEMTSDHIEKLLDSQRVVEGARDIFFANNGGREPFQMYFIALLSSLTGGVTFNTLKLAAAIESLLGILACFFLGRAVVGERTEQADYVGLLFALMAAVGYWHIAITRVSLRIMLTPLVTTLTLWALVRLLRQNRRIDAIWAGLALGFGLYSYQALRLLPAVAFAAVAIGALFVAHTSRQRIAYLVNLMVMAALTLAAFVPLLRFASDYPEDFWRRASGRLLGDDVICEYDEYGGCIPRSPTFSERIEALVSHLPALGQNMVTALGMYTYRGDIAWLHNAPNYPALDPWAGALLMSGLGAACVWAIRRKDLALPFILIALLIMLVPSASAIANPNENPSHTRASGTMPMIYLLVGLGGFGLANAVASLVQRHRRLIVGATVAAIIALFSSSYALRTITTTYDDFYQASWSPEREVGRYVRGFVDSGGAWGNVYLLSYAHFFDYRGVGINAGLPPGQFVNGDIHTEQLRRRMLENYNRADNDRWKLDPNRDILILYSANDPTTGELLKTWFPTGYAQFVETRRDTPWLPSEPFWAYRIPALGPVLVDALTMP